MQLVFGRSLIRSILDNNFDMNYGKQHLLLAKKVMHVLPLIAVSKL